MKYKPAILPFILWLPFLVFGQDGLLKGKLYDARTLEPLVFATVKVKGKSLGVVSNSDGSFRIPEKFQAYGDTLQISSMGYEKREILITTLSVDRVREIFVQPGIFELQEAVVKSKRKRPLSARKIIRRAIANIPKNYPLHPFSTVGYYRDYQLKENRYVNLNEAILEVIDFGFGKLDSVTTKVQIYEYKKNTDFERDTLADDPYNYKSLRKIVDNAYLFNYGGNEFTILRVHDAIRNYNVNSYSFVNRFDLDLINNHNFRKDNNTYLGNEPLYTINIRKTYPNYSAFGTLYISHGDYAIHKMEYTVYDDRKRNPDKILNKHNGSGRLLFEVVTEYQRRGDRMYLNYISFHNSFVLWEPPKFKLNFITWNLKRRCFVLEFNNHPDEFDAVNIDNYKVRFDKKKLKFRSVVAFANKVFLFPDMDQKDKLAMVEKLVENQKKGVDLSEVLSVNVEPIKDVLGNILNKWIKKDYDQFREYFTQQVKPTSSIKHDVPFMDNGKPIFKDQPIFRPDNFDDYWMNTPLKKIE